MHAHVRTNHSAALQPASTADRLCVVMYTVWLHVFTHAVPGFCVFLSLPRRLPLRICLPALHHSRGLKQSHTHADTLTYTHKHKPMSLHNYTCTGTSNPPPPTPTILPSSCTMSSRPLQAPKRRSHTGCHCFFLKRSRLRWWDLKEKGSNIILARNISEYWYVWGGRIAKNYFIEKTNERHARKANVYVLPACSKSWHLSYCFGILQSNRFWGNLIKVCLFCVKHPLGACDFLVVKRFELQFLFESCYSNKFIIIMWGTLHNFRAKYTFDYSTEISNVKKRRKKSLLPDFDSF